MRLESPIAAPVMFGNNKAQTLILLLRREISQRYRLCAGSANGANCILMGVGRIL